MMGLLNKTILLFFKFTGPIHTEFFLKLSKWLKNTKRIYPYIPKRDIQYGTNLDWPLTDWNLLPRSSKFTRSFWKNYPNGFEKTKRRILPIHISIYPKKRDMVSTLTDQTGTHCRASAKLGPTMFLSCQNI